MEYIHLQGAEHFFEQNSYLSDPMVVACEAHYEDTVCLSDAHLGPACHRVVTLIQDHTVDILLLTQPAEQPELIHTEMAEQD